nr:UvrB/UvrC motif-containing protein [Sporosarcina sp. JAI121]
MPHVFGKLHNGHANHVGKVPVSFNELYAVKRKIEEIREKMKEAVEAERFEEAAALRDEANTLKQHLAHGGEENDVD